MKVVSVKVKVKLPLKNMAPPSEFEEQLKKEHLLIDTVGEPERLVTGPLPALKIVLN